MTHPQTTLANESAYVLGHAASELDRLIGQARFFDDLTAQVLHLAGLAPGMRVLDIGCGVGDVSFLVASIVGPNGQVIGVDRSAEAIAEADRRATQAGLANVRFLTGDVTELTLEAPVDALVGRFVLMYLSEPAQVLRRLASFVQPGGVVVFHEMDIHAARSLPACPLFEATIQRIIQTFIRAGVDAQMGLKLGRVFQGAGLPAPHMISGARATCGSDPVFHAQAAQLTRTLLPLMERLGVATEAEIGIETLADRLREEAVAHQATQVSPPLIGAWTRIGPASTSWSADTATGAR